MTRPQSVAVLLLYCGACDGGGSSAPPLASGRQEAPAAVLAPPSASEIPPSATTPLPEPEPREPERPPPARVPPRTLAASWQSYLGQRVSLACKPVRRIDFVRTLVVADGAKFLVLGPPDATPCGPNTSTFTVIGSSSAAISGTTVLPDLVLEDDDGEKPPR